MALTPQDIARIANLARLELQPEEGERMLGQINAFFDIVAQISQVNTDGVLPMAHEASEPNDRQANQRSAPAVERGLFLVPKVIE